MCDQCLTNMLSVFSDSRAQYEGYYVGIVREADPEGVDDPTYTPGDVMIGRVNNPAFVIRKDLFTGEEWVRAQEDPEWVEEVREDELGEDYDRMNLGEKSPLASDRFVWGEDEGDIFSGDAHRFYWRAIPQEVKKFEERFGPCPEIMESYWTAYPVTVAAEIFQERGIPLDAEGRKEWAMQFDEDTTAVWLDGETFKVCSGDEEREVEPSELKQEDDMSRKRCRICKGLFYHAHLTDGQCPDCRGKENPERLSTDRKARKPFPMEPNKSMPGDSSLTD